MNICLVTPEFPPFAGGIATYTSALARILADAGHSVVILCTDANPPRNPPTSHGIQIVDLSGPQRVWQRRIANSFSSHARQVHHVLAAGMAVREWLLANAATQRIDVVEVPDYQGLGACLGDDNLPACIVAGHGTVGQIDFYDSGVAGRPSSRFVGTLESLALGCSDAVVCHSHSYRQELELGVGRDILFASAPFSFQEPKVALEKTRCDAGDGTRQPIRLIVLGRLQPWKGPEVLCEAIRIAQATTKVTVDWYGRSVNAGPHHRPMTTQIAERFPEMWGTGFRWHAPLSREEAMVALANADALVIASVWETFGYTAVEAATVGTPVIISEGAGASYLFRNNGAGMVFPAGDAGRLADAIRAIADVSARAAMSLTAKKVIQSELDSDKVATERIAVYEVAIATKAARRRSPYFQRGVAAIMDLLLSDQCQAAAKDVASLTAVELLAVVGGRATRRIARAVGWAGDRS